MTECNEFELVDIAIIGAGPAGLSAGLYAGRSGLNTVIFGDPYKGQLAKAGAVENFLTWSEPGFTGIQIVEKMVQHVEQNNVKIIEKDIKQIVREQNGVFQIFDSNGNNTCATSVIVATGAYHRRLGIPGEEELYAKGVGYCTICDGPLYKGKNVAIVGFGDEAAQAALRMATIASKVVVLATNPRISGDLSLLEQIQQFSNIELYENAKPLKIEGSNEVEKIIFNFNDSTYSVNVQAVFIENGVLPSSALASRLGVELENQFIKVRSLQETNIPGLYAAGDITGGKARQAIISSGDGARAGIGAIDYLKKTGRTSKKVKTTQWGAIQLSESDKRMENNLEVEKNKLLSYVEKDAGFLASYNRYTSNADITNQIEQIVKKGKIITISATWCPDCRRNVPKMARISETLKSWDFIVEDRDAEGVPQKYNIKKIPTFIIYDNTGKELGRIIENPKSNSLEIDLLDIVKNRQ